MGDKRLFERAMLGNLELKNRLVRSATWLALADGAGRMPKALYRTYDELARGGVGAIVTGFTSVAGDDRCFGGMARLSDDGLVPGHRRLVEVCHAQGCPVIAQIALGEYAGGIEPDRLSGEDIRRVVGLFVDAAVRAQEAGYDGVQVHAAHGFFLSRFVSPAFNHRSDSYGGSPEGRGRIVADIVRGVREVVPGLHVSMKVNSSDFIPSGLTPEESLVLCWLWAGAGAGSIEVSGNGTSVAGVRPGVGEAYFADFALKLADAVDVPVVLVGGHRSIANMEQVLNAGNIGFLSLSRPLICEPELPNRWCSGDQTPSRCISCNRCYRTPGHTCALRP